jgi:hypothetical protein
MNTQSCKGRDRTWFGWGVALTFALSIPPVISLFNAFHGISEQRATGLGAVAGGLAEGYVTFAVILTFVLPIAAIVLLVRSFARGHGLRSLFCLLCICWNAIMLGLAAFFVWLYLHQSR